MDFPELLKAIAAQFRTVSVLREVQYPAQSSVTKYPTLVLYSGSPETDIQIRHEPGQVVWTGTLYAEVLTARLGDAPQEIGGIDALICPLVDAFSILPDGSRRNLPGLTGEVDRVEITRSRPNLLIQYAGLNYAGAQLFIDFKFRRRPTS